MVIKTDDRKNGLWVPGYESKGEETGPAPTIDEIMNLFKEAGIYYGPFHKECGIEEDYYLGRRRVPAPENIDPIWPATATSIINVATDHVDVNNLSIDVPSMPKSRARAERIKKFYQGVWLSIKKPVLRTAVRQSFTYGIGWLKNMYDADKWPDSPKFEDYPDEASYKEALKEFSDRRCITFPFDVSVINPKNLIWDDSKSGTKWVIESYKRTVGDLKWQYPQWLSGKDSSDLIEWVEYWDREWCAYIIDGKFVWGPYRHGYGHLPYTAILPVHSHTFEDGSPQDRYWGINKPVRSLLDEEARLITQIDAIVRTIAWRTLDFQGPRQAAEKTADNYELFGGKNILEPGVSVQMSPMPQVPQDLYQQLVVIQNKIEEATFPNVIRGARPAGVSAGYAIASLAGMGRLVFQGVADGLRHAIEQLNTKFAQMVENKIKGRVTVHARTEVHNFDQAIGPEDIRGYYENVVQVKAEAPEEREREALLGLRLYTAGIITKYEAQKRAGIINPLEEQMMQRAEQLLETPEMIQAQVQVLLDRIGLPKQMETAISPTGDQPGVNPGNQNLGGAQLPRVGEANIQRGRMQGREGEPSVYPRSLGGFDILGSQIGSQPGAAVNVPSGERIS